MKFIKLFSVVTITILFAHTAMAAFTVNNDGDNKNKYSLKHLNKLTNNYLSFQSRSRTAQTNSSYFYTRQSNGLSLSSPVNNYISTRQAPATFVYPYKYTVKVPKFKVPVRPQQ